MIAYVFPPALGSGAFRPLSFANNLQTRGFNVHVLTASNYNLDNSAIDQTLCDKLDPHVEVHRARRYRSPAELLLRIRECFKSKKKQTALVHETSISPSTANHRKVFDSIRATIIELLSYPDNQIGWAPASYVLGKKLIREKKIDIVFVTGGPWSCLLTATLLKISCGIPVVLDFRDPWVSNPSNDNRPETIRKLNKLMEAFCVRNCDAIIANTEELRQDFLIRYSLLNPVKVQTIGNGFDFLYPLQDRPNDRFTVTHAGVFYLNRNPKEFLLAIRQLISEGFISVDKIQINFVGALLVDDEEVSALLSGKYLRDVVRIVPSVSHDKALEFQSASDVLLLVQPNFPLQVPRKLFEYLALQRPILAITEQSGATAGMIRKADVGLVVSNEISEIKCALWNMYQRWSSSTKTEMSKDKLLQFSNSFLTDKLGNILENIVQRD